MGAADRSREADDACRHRITQAIAELAHERQLSAASADDLCRRATVLRADFDRLFPSVSEAMRNAFAEAFDGLFVPVEEAVAAAPTWLEGIARALDVLLRVAGEQPRLAELCLAHSPAVPESAEHDYRAAVKRVASVVHTARVHAEEEAQQAVTAPALAEEFLAHGILFRAGQIAEQDGQATVRGRRGDLLMLVLMTFYGTADAARMCREVEG